MKIRRRKLEAGIPYLPMADIAFNLVLFFIIMAKTQDDSKLGLDFVRVPHVDKAVDARVRVAVNRDNQVFFNGNRVSINELEGLITRELEGAQQDKRIVLLKIHEKTQAATFEPIVEAVSKAGAEVFHVLDEEKRGP